MIFEWSEAKARKNESKHGGSFDEASSAFLDLNQLEMKDQEHSVTEERLLLIGYSSSGKLLTICFTDRDEQIRIISARNATPDERRAYEQKKTRP